MTKSVRLTLLAGICQVFSLSVFAQVPDTVSSGKLKSYIVNFQKFSTSYPQEKVYLHFDNTSYYLGETIWFKAYVVRADRNALSPLSKILYVELVTAEGYVVDTKKLKVENGQCHGDFRIPPANYGGFYEVRAFTRFMQNFGDQNYFSRVFPVYDKPETEGEYKPRITERPTTQRIPDRRPQKSTKADVQFFPEGGNLVSGVASRVAFKATGNKGENIVVSGGVFDSKGQKVADIESGYQGMGVFQFTPDASGNYYAKVQCDEKEYKFNLPAVQPSGYVMTVDNLSDTSSIQLQIEKSASLPFEPLGLSISCRGVVYGYQQVKIDTDNLFTLAIPRKLLPSGVAQITLFNARGKVESERLLFVNHHTQLKMQVAQGKTSYAPYEKVTMDFDLKDRRETPVEATFSVSIRDAGTSSETVRGDNILTNLLLSSELKGYIDTPGYYFESDSPVRRRSLDLLLMTQGWRRYEWQQMAGVVPFKIKQYVDKELTMDGTVTSLLSKKKVTNAEIEMVLFGDSTSQRGTCKSDSVGTFNFALKDYYGDATLILQSKQKDKLKEMNILLNRQFSPGYKPYSYAEINQLMQLNTGGNTGVIAKSEEDSLGMSVDNDKLSMDKKQHALKEVTVKAKRSPVKVNVSYKVQQEVDKLTDTNGWIPTNPGELLAKLNKYVDCSPCPANNTYSCKYKGKTVVFIRDNSPYISGEFMQLTQESNINQGTTLENSSNSETTSNGIDINAQEKENLDQIEGCVSESFPGVDEIESINIVENYSSILQMFPQVLQLKKKDIVLAVVHCKKKYVHEEVGTRNTTFSGYSYVKTFYHPTYNNSFVPKEKDYRRTLYWNPDVKTGKDGKAIIEFYNNGSCKAMNVSAETVTANGAIGGL